MAQTRGRWPCSITPDDLCTAKASDMRECGRLNKQAAGLHRRPANLNAGGALTSTSTASVTATRGGNDDVVGAIELVQPASQLRRLQSRPQRHSLEQLAKSAC